MRCSSVIWPRRAVSSADCSDLAASSAVTVCCATVRTSRSRMHSVSSVAVFLGVGQVLAQLAVGDPRVVEHALQAELLVLRLLEGAERPGDRVDQPAERGLMLSSSVILCSASISRLRTTSFSSPSCEAIGKNSSWSSSSTFLSGAAAAAGLSGVAATKGACGRAAKRIWSSINLPRADAPGQGDARITCGVNRGLTLLWRG